MNPAKKEKDSLEALVRRGAEQVLAKLEQISPLAWRIDSLDWGIPLRDALYSWPRGHQPMDKLYGSYFSMPGAAVMGIFPPSTAASLIQTYLSGFGASGAKMIPEAQALGEVANILVNAIGGVLADACSFSFFLPPPEVSLDSKTDLLEKLRHGVIQLQGPGQEAATLGRIVLKTAKFECALLVLLGESWRISAKDVKVSKV